MKKENSKSQLRKGLLEYCVLMILQHKEAYASDLLDALKKEGLIVVEGTLYPLLTRLKNGEYLTYHWQESTQGPPRKYYKITQKGKEFLTGLDDEWMKIVQTIERLRNQ